MEDISDNITITRINGSLSRGGWQCDFTSMGDTDIVATNQEITVMWRGGFGGPLGLPRTAFKGYVLPTRFQFDRATSHADFIAQTSDGYLRRGWLQGLGLADVNGPPAQRAHYHQWDSWTGGGVRMTLGRVIQHILGYYDNIGAPPVTNPDWVAHANLVFHATQNPNGWISLDHVETTPFDSILNPDGTMRVDRINIQETDNLWSRLTEIAEMEFFVIYFDKTDTLYYTKHPMYRAVVPNPVMTFDQDFCVVPPTVEWRSSEQVRQVHLAAVTDVGATMHSKRPFSPTYVYGKTADLLRLRCNDQNELDEWAQRYYLWLNRDCTVTWVAPGLCGLLFEILDRVQITYSGTTANGVHINWTEKKFWIHEIDVRPGIGFSGQSVFTLEAENIMHE